MKHKRKSLTDWLFDSFVFYSLKESCKNKQQISREKRNFQAYTHDVVSIFKMKPTDGRTDIKGETLKKFN